MTSVNVAAKVARTVCGAGLILLTSFWSLLIVHIVAGFAVGGVDGARGSLHRMLIGNLLWSEIGQDPLVAISRGYESLVFWLLATWTMREIYAYAGNRRRLSKPDSF